MTVEMQSLEPDPNPGFDVSQPAILVTGDTLAAMAPEQRQKVAAAISDLLDVQAIVLEPSAVAAVAEQRVVTESDKVEGNTPPPYPRPRPNINSKIPPFSLLVGPATSPNAIEPQNKKILDRLQDIALEQISDKPGDWHGDWNRVRSALKLTRWSGMAHEASQGYRPRIDENIIEFYDAHAPAGTAGNRREHTAIVFNNPDALESGDWFADVRSLGPLRAYGMYLLAKVITTPVTDPAKLAPLSSRRSKKR